MPICPQCDTAYLDGETHVCAGADKVWIGQVLKACSGVAIYFGALFASVNGANAYRHYHDEAAGGLAFLVIVNLATLGVPCLIILLALASRGKSFAWFAFLWAISAAAGCLQVLLLIGLLGL